MSAAPIEIPFLALTTISREQLKAYASASGDYNPIHQDDEVAKSAGLTGVIAHGMLTAALIGERALQFAHSEGSSKWRVLKSNTRFRSMTYPGDVVSVGGSVKNRTETEMTLDLQAKNQKGEVTTSGQVTLVRSE
jgi:acyl dehydratase